METREIGVALYDLEGPIGERPGPLDERSSISAVGPYQAEPDELAFQSFQDEFRTIAILNAGLMDDYGEDQADGVNHQVAFTAVDFLACVIAAKPPFSVVFTD